MIGGHEKSILKQLMASWSDRKITVRGLTFKENEEVITKATSLAMEGKKWKKIKKTSDYEVLKQFVNPPEEQVKK